MSTKRYWMISVAAVALAAPINVAWAADAEPVRGAVDVGLSEVIVTARKREETLQEVPVAVSAFDTARLEARGFDNVQRISFSMPNVALDSVGSSPSSASFAIRGMGGTSSVQSLEPGVGTFVDGAYLAVNAAVVSDTFDVENVQVLRGPQGTLFGRNVTGGAVLINTKRPSFERGGEVLARAETGLDAAASAAYTLGAAVTGPLSDKIAFRLSGYYKHEGGYGRNLARVLNPATNAPKRGASGDTWFIRPSILFEPNDGVSLLVRYEHLEHSGDAMPIQTWANFKRGETFDFSNNYPGHSETKLDNVTAELNVEAGPGTITNVFNYRNLRDGFSFDNDGTVNALIDPSVYTGSKQYSNELRYSGTVSIVDFTVGGYAYWHDLKSVENRRFSTGLQSGGGLQKNKSLALFTENQVHITERLTAILGARWTTERKRAAISQIGPLQRCGVIFPAANVNCILDARNAKRWNTFGFKLGAQYKFTDDVMAYGSFTRGFRSGGFNLRQTLPLDPIPFDEEQLDAIEVGLKATYFDGRARTNIAVYSNKANNYQRTVLVPIPVSPFNVQTTSNAADAKFEGFEIEQTIKVSDRILVTGYVGHIKAKYTSLSFDVNGDGVINARDYALKPTRVPKYSYGAQFSYEQPVGDSVLSAVVSIDHRDSNFFSDNNQGKISSVDMLGARLTYAMPSGLTVALFANNLLNDVVYGGATPTGSLIDTSGRLPLYTYPELGVNPVGTLSPIVQRPRSIGVEVRMNF